MYYNVLEGNKGCEHKTWNRVKRLRVQPACGQQSEARRQVALLSRGISRGLIEMVWFKLRTERGEGFNQADT